MRICGAYIRIDAAICRKYFERNNEAGGAAFIAAPPNIMSVFSLPKGKA